MDRTLLDEQDEIVADDRDRKFREEWSGICPDHKDKLLPDGCPQCAQERN